MIRNSINIEMLNKHSYYVWMNTTAMHDLAFELSDDFICNVLTTLKHLFNVNLILN